MFISDATRQALHTTLPVRVSSNVVGAGHAGKRLRGPRGPLAPNRHANAPRADRTGALGRASKPDRDRKEPAETLVGPEQAEPEQQNPRGSRRCGRM